MTSQLICLAAVSALTVIGLPAQAINLAKDQAVRVDSSWNGHVGSYAVDGVVSYVNRWVSDSTAPNWMIVQMPVFVELASAHIFTGRDNNLPQTEFVLQYRQGSSWLDIPGARVTGNTKTELALDFATPVRTNQVRLLTNSQARIKELALFAQTGVPLGTGVILNLAHGHLAKGSSQYRPSSHAVDGFDHDESRWLSENTNGPHYLELDLDSTFMLGSAHVYTGWGGGVGGVIRNMRLQYNDGSRWLDVPGAATTNNTNANLVWNFSRPIGARRVRLRVDDNGYARVRELVVLPDNGGVGYPLWTGVERRRPPTQTFEDYADSFHILRNRGLAKVMDSASGTAQLTAVHGGSSQHYQLLLNLGSDTYRIRNRHTGRLLAVRNASQLNGTAVVETTYEGMPHQKWRLERSGSSFYLRNVWSGMVLDAAGSNVVQQPARGAASQAWDVIFVEHYPKKGFAGWDSRAVANGANWLYNWGLSTSVGLGKDVNFAPMQWGDYSWGSLPRRFPGWRTADKPVVFMGFNEPDNTSQSNMTVGAALDRWPRLQRAGLPLVSPGFTHAERSWARDFMDTAGARGYRIDYTSVHWYQGPNADGFMSYLAGVHQRLGKPIWVTEFSTVDWGGNGQWDWLDNYSFLAEILWRFERTDWIRRYSMFLFTGSHTSKRSNFFANSNRDLTPLGRLYAAWDGDTTVHERQPYFVHNQSGHEHLQNASGLRAALPTVHGTSVQWVLLRAPSGGHYLVSVADGKRLWVSGGNVGLGPPGTASPAAEWQIVTTSHGWHHLDNASSNVRLRRFQGRFELATRTYNAPSTRWRFLKPLVSGPVPRHYGSACGRGSIGWSGANQGGQRFGFRLAGAQPFGPAILILGLRPATVRLAPFGMTGCQSNVDLGVWSLPMTFGTTDGAGRASIDLTVPTSALGHVYAQYAFGQPALNPLGVGSTLGLDVEFVR